MTFLKYIEDIQLKQFKLNSRACFTKSYLFIFPFETFYASFQVISTWGVRNNIDFLSLSHTRHAEDVRQVRTVPIGPFLSL